MHRVVVTATVRWFRRAAIGVGVLLSTPSTSAAQGQRTVLVTEVGTDRALPNAEIVNRANGEALLTDSDGIAVIPSRWAGVISLRVRQIGFRYADIAVPGTDSSRTIHVVLRRVAYTLPSVDVSRVSCADTPAPDAALIAATALEQLQMAAERYNTFKRQFPFTAFVERRTKTFNAKGQPVRDRSYEEPTPSSEWGERYDAKRIVDDLPLGFSVQILFLAHLADPAFWRRHCFDFEGIAKLASGPAIKLRFAPLPSVLDPEWEGSAFLDSATSELRRIEFRLSRLTANTRPYKLEGYTTFMSPIPSIVLPESTVAIWWRQKPRKDSSPPDILQLLRLIRVEYRKAVP